MNKYLGYKVLFTLSIVFFVVFVFVGKVNTIIAGVVALLFWVCLIMGVIDLTRTKKTRSHE